MSYFLTYIVLATLFISVDQHFENRSEFNSNKQNLKQEIVLKGNNEREIDYTGEMSIYLIKEMQKELKNEIK